MAAQRFKLLSVRMREGEEWQAAIRRVLRVLLRGISEHGYLMDEGAHTVEMSRRFAYSYPGLHTECTRHFVTVVLDERSDTLTLGHAAQDRFTTAEFAAGATLFKHHWAWYLPREWETIQKKLKGYFLKNLTQC